MPEKDKDRYGKWLMGENAEALGLEETLSDSLESRPQGVAPEAKVFQNQDRAMWYLGDKPQALVRLNPENITALAAQQVQREDISRNLSQPPAEQAFVEAARVGLQSGFGAIDSGVDATFDFMDVESPQARDAAKSAARQGAVEAITIGLVMGLEALTGPQKAPATAPATYAALKTGISTLLKTSAMSGAVGGGAAMVFGGAQSHEEAVMDAGAQIGGTAGRISMADRVRLGKAVMQIAAGPLKPLRPVIARLSAQGKIPTASWALAGEMGGQAAGFAAGGGDLASMAGVFTMIGPGIWGIKSTILNNGVAQRLGVTSGNIEDVYGSLDSVAGASLRVQRMGENMSEVHYEAALNELLDRDMINRTTDLTRDTSFLASVHALTNNFSRQVASNRRIDPQAAVEFASDMGLKQRRLAFPYEFGAPDVENLRGKLQALGGDTRRANLLAGLKGRQGKDVQADLLSRIKGKQGKAQRAELLGILRRKPRSDNSMVQRFLKAVQGNDLTAGSIEVDNILREARSSTEGKLEFGRMLRELEQLPDDVYAPPPAAVKRVNQDVEIEPDLDPFTALPATPEPKQLGPGSAVGAEGPFELTAESQEIIRQTELGGAGAATPGIDEPSVTVDVLGSKRDNPEVQKLVTRLKTSFVKNTVWDPTTYAMPKAAGATPRDISSSYFNGQKMLKYIEDNEESLKYVLNPSEFQVTKDIVRYMNFHQQAGYNIGSLERHAEQVTSFSANRLVFMVSTGAFFPANINPMAKAALGTGLTRAGGSIVIGATKLLEMGYRNPKAAREMIDAALKGNNIKSGRAWRLLIRTTDPITAQKLGIATEPEQEPDSAVGYWDQYVPIN